MRVLKFLAVAGLATALSATANAQVLLGTGGAATIVDSTGGTWDTVLPSPPNSSSAAVGVAVTSVESVTITGLTHTWIGDLQACLVDPAGVKHNIFVRPGYLNTSTFGNSGDFGGDYTFIESGAPNDLPNTSTAAFPPPGTYNQDFHTGGVLWTSSASTVLNTPFSSITGPAGSWSLHIYDWGGGDVGSYTGWSFTGNVGGGPNSGAAGCDCSAGNPSCFTASAAGSGCPNTAGGGVVLTGAGNADTALGMDTFSLSATGGIPGNFGIILSGTASIGPIYTVPDSAGGLCSGGSTQRSNVYAFDGAGSVSMPTFDLAIGGGLYGAASGPGFQTYQFWYRDPGGSAACTTDGPGGDFNFSNGWDVTWL